MEETEEATDELVLLRSVETADEILTCGNETLDDADDVEANAWKGASGCGGSDVGDEIEIDRRRGAITVGSSGETELVVAFIEEAADAGDRYESWSAEAPLGNSSLRMRMTSSRIFFFWASCVGRRVSRARRASGTHSPFASLFRSSFSFSSSWNESSDSDSDEAAEEEDSNVDSKMDASEAALLGKEPDSDEAVVSMLTELVLALLLVVDEEEEWVAALFMEQPLAVDVEIKSEDSDELEDSDEEEKEVTAPTEWVGAAAATTDGFALAAAASLKNFSFSGETAKLVAVASIDFFGVVVLNCWWSRELAELGEWLAVESLRCLGDEPLTFSSLMPSTTWCCCWCCSLLLPTPGWFSSSPDRSTPFKFVAWRWLMPFRFSVLSVYESVFSIWDTTTFWMTLLPIWFIVFEIRVRFCALRGCY